MDRQKILKEIQNEQLEPDKFIFCYVHNKEKSPRPNTKDVFGQKIEPSGKYIQFISFELAKKMAEYNAENGITAFEYGVVEFENPLIVASETTKEWKKDISEKYNGLTGKKLTDKLVKDGFDGIITFQRGYLSEVVCLKQESIKTTNIFEYPIEESRLLIA